MKTINFKELVKKIHPDYNPNIVDAGTKMTSAIRYKVIYMYLQSNGAFLKKKTNQTHTIVIKIITNAIQTIITFLILRLVW